MNRNTSCNFQRINKRVYIILTFSLVSLFSFAQTVDVGSYCQLTLDLKQLEINHLNAVLTLVRDYAEDYEQYKGLKQVQDEQYNLDKEALFTVHLITEAEYNAFDTQNNPEYDEFLLSHREMAKNMETSTRELDVLNTRLEIAFYCQLAILFEVMEIDNLIEMTAFAEQYTDSAGEYETREQLKKEEFEIKRNILYTEFNITTAEYMQVMSTRQQEVKDYFIKYPEVEDKINTLSGRLNGILDQYEALKAGILSL